MAINDPGTPLLDDATARSLLARAIHARAQAYAPYSHFAVGAALLGDDGGVTEGCNVENASYGLSNCAERTAIFTAAAQGARHFRAVAVVGPQDDAPCAPCGACRQVLYEFGGPEMVVVAPDGEGYSLTTMRDLLPAAFVPARLEER